MQPRDLGLQPSRERRRDRPSGKYRSNCRVKRTRNQYEMCGSVDQGIRCDQVTKSCKIICAQRCQLSTHPMLRREGSWFTLVLLGVPNACWGNVTRRKIPTEDNHFWDEVHFYAVVEHFSDPLQRGGVVQPHVRENKKVQVRKLLFDPNGISRLNKHRLSETGMHHMENCAHLPAASSPPCQGSLCGRTRICS